QRVVLSFENRPQMKITRNPGSLEFKFESQVSLGAVGIPAEYRENFPGIYASNSGNSTTIRVLKPANKKYDLSYAEDIIIVSIIEPSAAARPVQQEAKEDSMDSLFSELD